MMRAAMDAVTQKVSTVTPIILPARRMEAMLAMAEVMDRNTMGTTTQNIRLINTVPRGSSTVAPAETRSSPCRTTGNSRPTTQPAMMPVSMEIRKPLFLIIFFTTDALLAIDTLIVYHSYCKENAVYAILFAKRAVCVQEGSLWRTAASRVFCRRTSGSSICAPPAGLPQSSITTNSAKFCC